MTNLGKFWRLSYSTRAIDRGPAEPRTRVWTFLTASEALEHAQLMGLSTFHLEDVRSKVH